MYQCGVQCVTLSVVCVSVRICAQSPEVAPGWKAADNIGDFNMGATTGSFYIRANFGDFNMGVTKGSFNLVATLADFSMGDTIGDLDMKETIGDPNLGVPELLPSLAH